MTVWNICRTSTGLAVCRFKEHSEVLPSVDCNPGLVDDSPSSGRLWYKAVDARCRWVHKYRVYKDPFPHTALRGGGGSTSSSVVPWAMAIAQLTHLHISIPASGAPPGQVPEQCFPRDTWTDGPPPRVARQWCYNCRTF